MLVGRETLVVHPDRSGQAAAVRAVPTDLPLRSQSVPALVVGPILPVLPDLDGLFAELRRVLLPHGLLTMMVPVGPPLGLRARGLRADVRATWTHHSAVDHTDWLLTAADFAVMGDDRVEFRTSEPLADPAAHVDDLCAAGLLPPALPPDLRARLAAQAAVRAGRLSLRRLVARR